MSNARIIEIPATRQIRSGKNNTIHSYTNARTGKSKTLADAGITFWESELLHDGYRITDQTGTRASRPYTTKIG